MHLGESREANSKRIPDSFIFSGINEQVDITLLLYINALPLINPITQRGCQQSSPLK